MHQLYTSVLAVYVLPTLYMVNLVSVSGAKHNLFWDWRVTPREVALRWFVHHTGLCAGDRAGNCRRAPNLTEHVQYGRRISSCCEVRHDDISNNICCKSRVDIDAYSKYHEL